MREFKGLGIVISGLLIAILSFAAISSKEIKNGIVWSPDDKLEWSDFKMKAEADSRHAALSHCGMTMAMSHDETEMTFKIKALFDPAQSWVKSDEPSDYLLAHEQLHFDIYERYVRELRKALKTIEFGGDIKAIPEQVQALYQSVNDRLNQAQEDYDRETKHSLDKEAQLEWNERIAADLKKLADHAELEFSVR
jgi:FtsZ-binding cell division protein ZapB